ncbi:hypothetical protein P43SY_007663 [Pythium insidiosum]|uniref:Apple domain-containing protein n=1 Tax=Pythium insidiosum TaxID=114742 RepID=A0AAD5Q839_PYTIN|nr:hypothetical protein P43SY_007663 [Pythium insidiosum]
MRCFLVAIAAVLLSSAAAQDCPTKAFGTCGTDADNISCCPNGFYCQPWRNNVFQCIPTPSQCSMQLINVDLYGNDLKAIYNVQPGDCCAQCAQTPGCVGYTFVDSDPSGPACYLKNSVGTKDTRRTRSGVVSGVLQK